MMGKTPRVLFFAPYGSWLVHNQLDAILASALRIRGADVAVVTCDGLFKRCYTLVRSKNPESDCRNCAFAGQSFFSQFNLPIIQLRSLVSPHELTDLRAHYNGLSADELLAYNHDEVNLGRAVMPSVCSYFRVPKQHLSQPHVVELGREYLAYALLTYRALSRLFEQYSPTHLCLMNGYGFSHSSAFHLAKRRGVKIVTHERGVHEGSFLLCSEHGVASPVPLNTVGEAWSSIPLTRVELERTRDFFLNRECGKDCNFYSYYSFQSDHHAFRARLGIPENRRILSVFTSTEYELLYVWDDFSMVARQLDIVDRLIELFRSREDYLVIRHHPNIGGGPAGMAADTRLLTRAYEQAARAPSNVRVIMPDDKVTSYALAWNSDAAIAFYSTMRLETVARGVPTASCNHPTLYRGLTAHIDGEDPASLTMLVDNLFARSTTFGVEDLRALYRTTHSYFFQLSTRFRSVEIRNGFEIGINVRSLDELQPGHDQTLDRVCNHFFEGSSLYPIPSIADSSRTSGDEEKFLTHELQRLHEYRASLRKGCEQASKVSLPSVAFLVNTEERADSHDLTGSLAYPNYRTVAVSGADLFRTLATLPEDLVVLTDRSFHYDTTWLSELVDLLIEQPALRGAASGFWLRHEGCEIHASMFTKKSGTPSYPELVQQIPAFSNSNRLLGAVLLRREAALELLREVRRETSQASSGAFLYSILQCSDIGWIDRPLALFSSGALAALKAPPQTRIIEQPMPEEIDSRIQRAVALLQDERNQEALSLLLEVLPIKQDMPELFYAKAVAETRLGMRDQARTSLSTLLERDPRHLAGKRLLEQLS